jgi:hypothetical protein
MPCAVKVEGCPITLMPCAVKVKDHPTTPMLNEDRLDSFKSFLICYRGSAGAPINISKRNTEYSLIIYMFLIKGLHPVDATSNVLTSGVFVLVREDVAC